MHCSCIKCINNISDHFQLSVSGFRFPFPFPLPIPSFTVVLCPYLFLFMLCCVFSVSSPLSSYLHFYVYLQMAGDHTRSVFGRTNTLTHGYCPSFSVSQYLYHSLPCPSYCWKIQRLATNYTCIQFSCSNVLICIWRGGSLVPSPPRTLGKGLALNLGSASSAIVIICIGL